MKFNAKVQLKIRDFFKKYKKIILIVFIVWTVIFTINQFMKDKNATIEVPSTTYTPHVSVMDNTNKVPIKLQEPISNLIDQYFNYCNNGEYENAYNMLTDECKQNKYKTLASFEAHVKPIFGQGGKIYNIQDFSNLDNTYIYTIKILEDILASGTTDGYTYYEEKITIIGDSENNLKLSIDDFIDKEEMSVFAEDDYLKIEVLEKIVSYDTETYKVKITNKSEFPIVLANNEEDFEVGIYIGDQTRKLNLPYGNYVIYPNSEQTRNLEFPKFADDGKTTQKLIFNAVRVLKSYSDEIAKYEDEINNAVKLYSLTIDL